MILPAPVVLLLLVINVSADDGARIGVADVEVVAVVVVDVVVLDKISKVPKWLEVLFIRKLMKELFFPPDNKIDFGSALTDLGE